MISTVAFSWCPPELAPRGRAPLKSSARTATPRKRRTLRLSASIVPEKIDLHLHLDPARNSFRGEACYSLRLEKSTHQIELHGADLSVSSVHLVVNGKRLSGQVEAHPECETLLLRFPERLPEGPVELSLKFRGKVRGDLRGLYRSADRSQPWIASQLCPTDARRLFPCFDEPGIKACYSIRVTAPADQTVLSNSKVSREVSLPGNRKRVDFEPTPPLSAYLIAVAVGPFEASRVARCGPTEIRVYTLPGRQPLARFARKAAVESLERLERWFGMPHPYSKLDLLALPDFAFGAMENAGAVFFRDSVLLLDEKEASSEDLMRTAETIAHEISHMWFGNLVTMAWWNDLWLNESFATWMAYEIVDDWRPEWRIWLAFIQRRESALQVDALSSSHPIAPPIRTAEEAHENFDAITYTKGASVLRMLERFLGAKTFQDGVRRYVRQHREGAATASDLWSALSETSGLPVEKIVAPWTLQTGYPILRVRQQSSANGSKITLRQERFLSLPPKASARQHPRPQSKAKTQSPRTRWSIPWVGRVGRAARSREVRHLLERGRDQLPHEGTESRWIYGNASESGFFRVDHGPDGFAALLNVAPRLSNLERLGFVGHQWALVTSGRASITSILDLTTTLRDEHDPDVLFAIDSVLATILRRVAHRAGPELTTRFREWIAEQFLVQIGELQLAGPGLRGKTRDSLDLRRRRARLISIAGGLAGTPALAQNCLALAEDHVISGDRLTPGAGDQVIHVAAQLGDGALQRLMLGKIRDSKTPQIRRRFLFALAGFTGPAQRRVTFRATLNRRLAPSVDRAGLIMSLLASPSLAPEAWHHLQQTWPRLEKEMPPILLARIVGETSKALPASAAPSIRAFFADHPLAAGSRVIRQVSEEMRIAERLERKAGPELATYLAT